MSKSVKIIISVVACLLVAALLVVIFYGNIKSAIAYIHDSFNAPAVEADFEVMPDDTIRIMSFNIRYGDLGVLTAEDRYDAVKNVIKKGFPDSIGLQEATPEWMDYLKTALDGYAYVGVGRDDGDNQGEYAAIFYLEDKYNVVDSGTFWLSDTPDVVSKGWGADCYRICTWAILENKITGERYVHMNAHFDYANDEVRYNSADLILEKAKEFGDIPVVYTADMNFSETSEYYLHMKDDGYFIDAKEDAEDTMDYLTYHDRNPKEHEDSKIDYILINDKFDAKVFRVVTDGIDGKYVSDHFPLYADIKFAD
ncbi:MAG: endonuclease/exonuclease/phosphatase family protein [Clostridia bacterium]|nr:endonuclease/exonuclease/phosphatase family protein [Clostridia bacterium]